MGFADEQISQPLKLSLQSKSDCFLPMTWAGRELSTLSSFWVHWLGQVQYFVFLAFFKKFICGFERGKVLALKAWSCICTNGSASCCSAIKGWGRLPGWQAQAPIKSLL